MAHCTRKLLFLLLALCFLDITVFGQSQFLNPFEPENTAKGSLWHDALKDSLANLDNNQVQEAMQKHLPKFKNETDAGWMYLIWGNQIQKTNPAEANEIYQKGIQHLSEGQASKVLANLYLNLYNTWAPNQISQKLSTLQKADSLIQLNGNQELKFKLYQRYAVFYAQTGQPDKNEAYRNRALKQAKELKRPRSLASMYANMSMFNQHFGQLDSALYFIQKALEQDSIETITLAKIHLQRSKLYAQTGKSDSAAIDLNVAYSLFEEINDTRGMIISLEDLMTIYGIQGDFEQSIKVAVRLRKYLNPPYLGGYHYNVSKNYLYLGELEKASAHADSLRLALKTNPSKEYEASSLSLTGEILCEKEEWQQGLTFLYQAYELLNGTGFKNRALGALNIFSKYYTDVVITDTFIQLPEYGFNRAEDLIPILEQVTDAELLNEKMDFTSNQFFSTLSVLYEQAGQHELALKYFKLGQIRKDSIYNREKFAATQKFNLQTKEIESARVEAELRANNAQNKAERDQERTMKYWAFSMVGLLVFIVFFAVYQLRKNKLYTTQLEEQKRLIEQQRDQLKELDELKSSFFANISHELRTPLTLILGPITDVVRKRSDNLPNDVNQLLHLAFRNGNKLQELVNEILDLGKLETGELKVNLQTVQLHQFIRRVFFTFESLAILKSIQLQFDYQLDESQNYLADTNKLDKVLSNLVNNALKFTANGGKVTLRVAKNEHQIAFVVTDTGAGIHPDDLEKVFDRYYQSRHQKEGAGTGIGLSFAQQLAILMNGSLKATSEYGKGSTFTLLLPLTISNEEAILFEENEEETSTSVSIIPENLGSDSSILVVEDNPEMQQYLETTLNNQFHTVVVNNGKEAIAQLETKRFSLILSDLMMPQMDGMELLETVKDNDDWKNIPFVMLTAKATDKDRMKALNVGLDDYLLKPFNTDELVVRISNLISNHQERNSDEPEENEDQQWLQKVQELTQSKLTDRSFNVALLAEELHMVERQVYRKMKKLTGLTPNKFIQEMRLRQARNYLESGTYKTVKEVAASVGFDTYQYFSKIYTQRFGKKPIDYLR